MKVGLDDLLAAHGKKAFDEVIAHAPTFEEWRECEEVTQVRGQGIGGRQNDNGWECPQSKNGELGIWKTVGQREEQYQVFVPKANFDFEILSEFLSEDGGGIVMNVKRSFDRTNRTVFIHSKDYSNPERFTDAIKAGYGAGVVCLLTKAELGGLIHTRLRECRQQDKQPKRLIGRRGRQPDGTWVFKNCQFTSDGNLTTSEESGWVYTAVFPNSEDWIPSPEIAVYDPRVLQRYLEIKRQALGNNFMLSLLIDGFVVASLHDQEIMRQEGFFPLINPAGNPGSNKTIIAEASLSLVGFGGTESGLVSKITESALYECGKRLGSLPLVWDDPRRDPAVDELCKRWYNRAPRVVRGNEQRPQGALGVTTNHLIGEENPAVLSRFIPLYFPVVSNIEKSAILELREIQKTASGCFPDLIKLGYPRESVKLLEKELFRHLGAAHDRTALNLAIVVYYASEIVRLSGLAGIDIKQWVIQNLCPQLNESQGGLDSASDFLTRLRALESRAMIGEWCLMEVNTQGSGRAIALHMPTVWKVFDREFSPSYSKAVLEHSLTQAGATRDSVQKFWENREQTIAYKRRLVTGGSGGENADPPQEPEKVSRRCLLVPESVLDKFGYTLSETEASDSDSENDVTGVSNTCKADLKSHIETATAVTSQGNWQATEGNSTQKETTEENPTQGSSYTQLHVRRNQQSQGTSSNLSNQANPVTSVTTPIQAGSLNGHLKPDDHCVYVGGDSRFKRIADGKRLQIVSIDGEVAEVKAEGWAIRHTKPLADLRRAL